MNFSQSQMSHVIKVLESTLKEEIVSLVHGKLNQFAYQSVKVRMTQRCLSSTGYRNTFIVPVHLQGFYLLTSLSF